MWKIIFKCPSRKPVGAASIDTVSAIRKMMKAEARNLANIDMAKKIGGIDFNLSRLFGKLILLRQAQTPGTAAVCRCVEDPSASARVDCQSPNWRWRQTRPSRNPTRATPCKDAKVG